MSCDAGWSSAACTKCVAIIRSIDDAIDRVDQFTNVLGRNIGNESFDLDFGVYLFQMAFRCNRFRDSSGDVGFCK